MRRAVVVVAVAAALLAGGCGGGRDSVTPDDAPSTTAVVDISSRVTTYVVPSRQHVQGPVDYPQKPPVGGDHAPVWQNCGFYAEPVPTERAVHSMEHGAVWITYRPDLSDQAIRTLRAFARADPYVLVSPWPDDTLPAPVVASAWGVQLTADSAADPGIGAFVEKYARGAQAPEPSAPCSGGLGTPS